MPPKRSLIVTIGAWLTGVGLILLGLQCLVYPGAADGYGVSPLDANGTAFLLATGMRDFVLGLVTIYLLLRHRATLPIFFLIMIILPLADTLIVLKYGTQLIGILPHVVGIVGLSVIAWFAFHEQSAQR
ncbi:MAG: DUF4267 domain-containing protein [Planctomycetota bacterium]